MQPICFIAWRNHIVRDRQIRSVHKQHARPLIFGQIISVWTLEEPSCMCSLTGLAIILQGPQAMPKGAGLVFRKIRIGVATVTTDRALAYCGAFQMYRALTRCALLRGSTPGLVIVFIQRAALPTDQDMFGMPDRFCQEMSRKERILASTARTVSDLDPQEVLHLRCLATFDARGRIELAQIAFDV